MNTNSARGCRYITHRGDVAEFILMDWSVNRRDFLEVFHSTQFE